jgi:hypothetical protein
MATRPRYPPLHNIAVKKQNKKALQYYIYTCIYRLPHESCFSVPASKLKLKFDNSRSHIYQLAKWSHQENKVVITTNQSLTFKNLTNF